MSGSLVIGIDVGTSGARAVAMNAQGDVAAQAAVAFDTSDGTVRSPAEWWRAVTTALHTLLERVDANAVRAIAVDGTSGTVLPVASDGEPLAEPMMYNDAVQDSALVARIGEIAPAESAAHGPTSGLAKAIGFAGVPRLFRIIHQADWIAGQFCGRFDLTDENNALKTGYDPVARRWPDWIAATGFDVALLPDVQEPGSVFGPLTPAIAQNFGLAEDVMVIAGTTDGCASFLATGASEPGDGVTALGTSLTIKLLSRTPIFAPQYGIYSHRIGDVWLAGGASNSGGRVLLQFFDRDQLKALSASIRPDVPTGLDYYPLPGTGERFPVADRTLQPRMEPRPADDATFLQGLLEGIASIEHLGYHRLEELGAPALSTIRSVGGGAQNSAWSAIRQRKLGVPFLDATSTEAAAGVARLALKGLRT